MEICDRPENWVCSRSALVTPQRDITSTQSWYQPGLLTPIMQNTHKIKTRINMGDQLFDKGNYKYLM